MIGVSFSAKFIVHGRPNFGIAVADGDKLDEFRLLRGREMVVPPLMPEANQPNAVRLVATITARACGSFAGTGSWPADKSRLPASIGSRPFRLSAGHDFLLLALFAA